MIENINLNGATVSAELHGFMYNNVFGYTGVFKYGSAMEAEIVSNNEIKIKDGLLSNYGRFMRISGYETLAIENGTSGVARTDLIVAHFETDGINESHDLRVIKGASGGAIPSYTTGDLYNGDTVNEMPLYAVHLEGLTVTGLTRMFIPLFSLDELRNNLVNDNLLINSDFRNPINQRGQTSYWKPSSWTYNVDRWTHIYNSVILEDGYIRIYNDSGETGTTFFKQIFERPLEQNDYTVTVNVKEINGIVQVEGLGTLVKGLNVFTIKNTSLPQLQLNLVGESSVELYYIKLEQGSIATPLVPRPYGEELALCQRYYYKIAGSWMSLGAGVITGNGDAVSVPIHLPTTMRTAPTVNDNSHAYTVYTYNGLTNATIRNISFEANTSFVTIDFLLNIALTKLIPAFVMSSSGLSLSFDAEIR